MAKYTAQQLISASNATYVTNTSGSITAADVRSLNDSWISSSALLSGSNTFTGNQTIDGTLTAQLPANNIWLGNSSGYAQAYSTSSLNLQGATGAQGSTGAQGASGSVGSQGPAGTNGQAGTQGSQGAAGQNAQGIQGAQGANGTTGAGFYWQSNWSSVVNYVPNDVVVYNGSSYIAVANSLNLPPDVNPTEWDMMAAQGVQGIQGGQGAIGQGVAGLQGVQGIAGAQGAQVTINNNTNNNILTATGTATLQGENNLTFDGTTLQVIGNVDIDSSLTASLQEGYVWVGGAGDITTTVPTSSFGSSGVGFITTGSASSNQFISGGFTFNTRYTGSQSFPSNGGGADVLYVDYSQFYNGSNMLYWANLNTFADCRVNGPGVSDASVVSTNFGSNYEMTLSTGTVVNGGTYVVTGPAFQPVYVSGSVEATQELRVKSASGKKAVVDENGFYAIGTTGFFDNIQTGASVDGGVYSVNIGTNYDSIRLAITGSSIYGDGVPNVWKGPQIGGQANYNPYTAFGFQDSSNYTDGRIAVLTPLSASAGFTASLQNGYAWVGNSLGQNSQVATSSFGGGGATFPYTGDAIITGSLLVSGSQTPSVKIFSSLQITSSNDTKLFNASNQQITISDKGLPQMAFGYSGTVPGFYGWDSSNNQYIGFSFQPTASYTDGRVTFERPLKLNSSIITPTSYLPISGALLQSSSNYPFPITAGPVSFGYNANVQLGNRVWVKGGDGTTGGPTGRIILTGDDGRAQTMGGTFQTIDYTNGTQSGLGADYTGYSNTGSYSQITLGVYDNPAFNTDIEVQMGADINGIYFKDWDNVSTFNYVPWLTIAPNVGDDPIPQFTRGLNVTGSFTVNGVAVTGSQGAQGATGQGVQGFIGSQGIQGTQGTAGVSPQAVQGAQGAQGQIGPQGATGTGGAGYAGLATTASILLQTGNITFTANQTQGSNAYQVGNRVRLSYVTNPTLYWEEGVITAYSTNQMTVAVDLVNVSGGTYTGFNIGIAGEEGPIGLQGIQGTSGQAGANGAQGVQGPSGAAGQAITGPQGATGATGTGTQGPAGTNGSNGAQGPAGTNGTNGTNGSNGSQGSTGAQGFAGATGGQGVQGSTGAAAQLVINSNSNNYVLTATGTSTLQGEGNMQFDGSTLSVTGAITATGNITAYYSDGRLKEILSKIDSPLEKLKLISGYYYTQNKLAEEFGYNDYSKQIGVIAQEIKEVIPEAIARAPFDDDGKGGSKTGEDYLAVHYEKLIPLLIECIKEQQTQIEELKNK